MPVSLCFVGVGREESRSSHMTDPAAQPAGPASEAPAAEALPPAEEQYQAGLQAIRVRAANADPSPPELKFKPSGMQPVANKASVDCVPIRLLCAQDNQLEKAVELFANVLQSRIEHYGGVLRA